MQGNKFKSILLLILLVAYLRVWADPVPTTLNDFFLPGSQPGQSGNLETPDKCDNCHGGYDVEVEPAFNWRGSMMSQAARDPLFYACLAISNQDAPECGDLCIRCHSPAGWLEGRSTPTDGSALNNNDREGVQCDFCHKAVKPTELGVNPYPEDSIYTADTYPRDQTYLATLDSIPRWNANGMYIADSDNSKRGPFSDAEARHQKYYSPFHQDSSFCGTCHDVSNPVYTRDPNGNYVPNIFDQPSPDFDPYSMFPIERTFSEWKMSEYNTPQGVYAPQFGGNKDSVSTCQDCHLRDVTGVGCNKAGAPTRNNLPFHDMTGANTFIPSLIESVFPGESDPAALDSGIIRATYMLKHAASMTLSSSDQGNSHLVNVNIVNETAHKLPSGYPEGRRIWINIKAYDSSNALIYESGAYDSLTGDLSHDLDVKIYEIKPGISNELSPIVNLPAGPSFHFVLNDSIYKDNRIPPRGFTNVGFEAIQSPPVGYSYADGQYWDDTQYPVPGAAAKAVATLYYQTTSREYVEFLRDENNTNDWGNTFYGLWANNGKSRPVPMVVDSLLLEPTNENSPPVAQCRDVSAAADDNCHADVSIDDASYDPDGDPLTIIQEPAGPYPLGQTTVMLIVSDDGGLADTCQGVVTVYDDTPPFANCPPDTSLPNETGLCGAAVSFEVDATDNCVGVSVVSNPPSGSFFAVGSTQVEVVATDASANADTCYFSVTVIDAEQPVAICPPDTSLSNETGLCGATVSFEIDATDNCEGVSVASSPPSGSFFPVGTTAVEVVAVDASQNADTCYFNVTVNDSEPPVAECPPDTTILLEIGQNGAYVEFDFSASDNCEVADVVADPPSGSWFTIGDTTVEVVATDIYENADTCYFTITVVPYAEDIPTISAWGMLILGLLLLATGTVAVLTKRKPALKQSEKVVF